MEEDKPSQNSHSNLPTTYGSGNVKSALADRMTLSEGIEAAARMVSGYANRGQADKGYIGAMASILCDYPRQIATECASPIHGVARECKFMPTVADIVAWCEPRLQRMTTPSYTSYWEGITEAARRRAAMDPHRNKPKELGATRSDLCKIYGIRAVPPGWDAVDVCQAKGRLGAKFHEEVERLLAEPGTPPESVFTRVVASAKQAMEGYKDAGR